MPPKRIPIIAEQKAVLRAHHRSQYPPPDYKELSNWFQQQYNRPIARSSVSEILSSRYDYLDQSKFQPSTKRRRVKKWPELKTALIQWVRAIEDKVTLTGDLLKLKEEFSFERIPSY
ncbi:hypothetical protein K432DRAFT_295728 [Lepidopterella palustris CBS 459.81]|uniref:ARS-binding protein 1 N-terminal domain-containing protein n=1 Tax=Lepidopterella palustris CBS 459.81 TaxID=1314670 RepID=A0A8E2EC76_9PEZI|nr:hypothetical protein K432DRAFT_295728 [Lepidopterella palustris CBS 459.81]